MARHIIILGNAPITCEREYVIARETYVINDWYTFHGWFPCPQRIYQIHTTYIGEFKESPHRFKDWRKWYASSGAEIVVQKDLGFKRQRIVTPNVEIYGVPFFSSPIGYMAQDCIAEGVDTVELQGIAYDSPVYKYQVCGVLTNIDAMRKAGIKVIAQREDEWRGSVTTVDWKNAHALKVPYGGEGFGIGVKNACYNPNDKQPCPEIKIVIDDIKPEVNLYGN